MDLVGPGLGDGDGDIEEVLPGPIPATGTEREGGVATVEARPGTDPGFAACDGIPVPVPVPVPSTAGPGTVVPARNLGLRINSCRKRLVTMNKNKEELTQLLGISSRYRIVTKCLRTFPY